MTKMQYFTNDGVKVTRDEIKKAYEAGLVVLRWGHGNWKNTASLIIARDQEDAGFESDVDTRGDCWSMSDECWSTRPETLGEALKAGCGQMSYS